MKSPLINFEFHDFHCNFHRLQGFNKVSHRQSMLSIQLDNSKINYWRLRYLKTNFHFDFYSSSWIFQWISENRFKVLFATLDV